MKLTFSLSRCYPEGSKKESREQLFRRDQGSLGIAVSDRVVLAGPFFGRSKGV